MGLLAPPSGQPVDSSCNNSTSHSVSASPTCQPHPWKAKAHFLVHTWACLSQSQHCAQCHFPHPQPGLCCGLPRGCQHQWVEGGGCPEALWSPRKTDVHKPLGTILIAFPFRVDSWLFFLQLKKKKNCESSV